MSEHKQPIYEGERMNTTEATEATGNRHLVDTESSAESQTPLQHAAASKGQEQRVESRVPITLISSSKVIGQTDSGSVQQYGSAEVGGEDRSAVGKAEEVAGVQSRKVSSGVGEPAAEPFQPSKPLASSSTSKPTLPAKPVVGFTHYTAAPSGSLGEDGESRVLSAVYLGDLHWWTSDKDIKVVCEQIGVPIELKDVAFSEHKVNGKSKGIAYIELHTTERAAQIKNWFEVNDFQNKRMSAQLGFGGTGRNPFQTLPKEPTTRENRGQRHVSGASSAGGAAPLPGSVQSSPRAAQAKPTQQHHHPQSYSYPGAPQGQLYQQPPQTQPPQQPQGGSSPQAPASAMPTPYWQAAPDPAMLHSMGLSGYVGGMYSNNGMMGGYPTMPSPYPGGFAAPVESYHQSFHGAFGGDGASFEFSHDAHRKRTRLEG